MKSLNAVAFALVLAPALAHAVGTETWRIDTPAAFRAGKLERIVVTSSGEVLLGRDSQRAPIDGATLAWSVIRAPGGGFYVGTGPKGVVHRVAFDAAGKPKVEKAFDTKAFVVTSLAVDPRGDVYAGTIPEGRIFKYDASTKVAKELVQLPAKYVWALALVDGKLFAATGPTGALYAVDLGTAKATVHYQTKEKHLLSMASAGDGSLYVGTAPKAMLLKVSPKGQASVAHDFDGDEVRAIAVHRDAVYAAVNGIKGKLPLGTMLFGAQPGVTQPRDRKQQNGGGPGGAPSPAAALQFLLRRAPMTMPGAFGQANLGEGSLYRIGKEGRVESLLKMPRGYFSAIGVDETGHVYAGSGAEGRVYRVAPNRDVAVVLDFEEKQVLAMDVRPTGAMTLGTANGAALYTSPEKKAQKGTFFSRVFDGRFPSRWGSVQWRADGAIAVQSRSGNAEMPDESWSPWTPLRVPPAAREGKVQSPSARYLQLRVDFGDDAMAVLRGLTAYYLQQNQRPRILSVDVGGAAGPGGGMSPLGGLFGGPPRGPGMTMRMRSPFGAGMPAFGPRLTMGPSPMMGMGAGPMMTPPPKDAPAAKPISAPAMPSPRPRHQLNRRVSWKVENPDGDPLVAWVWVREQSAKTWILLNPKEPIAGTSFEWNTESFPDGHYLVKVKVSDERANPRHLALVHERTSAPVLVDNRKPEIVGLAVDERSLEVRCVARDSFSAIRAAEYSVDGGEWNVVHPEDGLFDELEEKLRFDIAPRPLPGAHTLTVRAFDSDGNLGSASVVFTVP